MNATFQCGDPGALIAYLYDECEPDEHGQIAAHIARCAVCASEVEALRATRRTLGAWAPPHLALGFQITRSDVAPMALAPTRVLEPRIAWWRAPLPAWAQAAAALVIFGAGLFAGMARNGSIGTAAAPAQSSSAISSAAAPAPTTASREDLAQLEQRIKAELSQVRSTTTATPVASRGSDDALLQQVKTLIEESEANQRRDFTLRMVDLASTIERQRRVDLASIGNSMGQFRGATRDELRQQNEAFSEALRRLVSESSR